MHAHPYFGFPRWISGKETACQCRSHRRHQFDPWGGNIPWSKKWPPTLVFLPGKSYGQRSLASYSPWDCKRVGHNLVTNQPTFILLSVLFEYNWFTMLCWFLLYNKVNQSCACIYSLSLEPPTPHLIPLGHHRALS